MAKLELSRELSLTPEDAWAHVSNLAALGDWLVMHQGWRGEVPAELTTGATLVGVAGAKGLRNRVTWTVREVEPPRLLEMTGDGVGGTKYALTMTVSRPHPVVRSVQAGSGWQTSVRADRGGRRAGGEGRYRTIDRAVRSAVQPTPVREVARKHIVLHSVSPCSHR